VGKRGHRRGGGTDHRKVKNARKLGTKGKPKRGGERTLPETILTSRKTSPRSFNCRRDWDPFKTPKSVHGGQGFGE